MLSGMLMMLDVLDSTKFQLIYQFTLINYNNHDPNYELTKYYSTYENKMLLLITFIV